MVNILSLSKLLTHNDLEAYGGLSFFHAVVLVDGARHAMTWRGLWLEVGPLPRKPVQRRQQEHEASFGTASGAVADLAHLHREGGQSASGVYPARSRSGRQNGMDETGIFAFPWERKKNLHGLGSFLFRTVQPVSIA